MKSIIDKVVYLPESARTQIGNCFVKTHDFLIRKWNNWVWLQSFKRQINGFAFGSFMIRFNLKKKVSLIKNFIILPKL